jgi:hypothetical protein
MLFVSCNISVAFILPELRPRFRNDFSPSAIVTVPEAAMHEYYHAVFRQNDIWFSWEVFSVEPVSVAESVKRRPNPHFRFGIPALYRRHVTAALCGGVNVGHAFTPPLPDFPSL